MQNLVMKERIEKLSIECFSPDPTKPYTISELIRMAEDRNAPLSHLVVAQAMAAEKLGYEEYSKRSWMPFSTT